MSDSVDVVMVGAGPYGLSIAAHLRGAGVRHPLARWRVPKNPFVGGGKYHALSKHLRDDQPVLGLLPRGSTATCHTRVEDRAAYYVDATAMCSRTVRTARRAILSAESSRSAWTATRLRRSVG